MAAKRYRDIKKEFPIDEGKLVADKNTILKTILGKIEKMVSKELCYQLQYTRKKLIIKICKKKSELNNSLFFNIYMKKY